MRKPKKRKKLLRSSLRGLALPPPPTITAGDLLGAVGALVSIVVTHIVRPDGTRTPAPPIYPVEPAPAPDENVIETTAEEVPVRRALPPGGT